MAMNTSRGVGDGKYPTLGALETNADRAIREGDLLFIASTGEAYQATTDVSASAILNTSPQLYANLRSGGGSGGSETPASIKTKYESNANTNAFTDAEKSKLSGVGEGANIVDIIQGSGVTIDKTDPKNPIINATGGSGGSVDWGGIGGTLSNQTDLNNALGDKVDKVAGKGLSTNDYDNAAAQEVAKVAGKVDKVAGKGLSENDYNNAAVQEVAKVADKSDKSVVSEITSGALPSYAAWVVDSSSPRTVSTPVSPVDGDRFSAFDSTGSAESNNATITPQPGDTIDRGVLDKNGQSREWQYVASSNEWKLVFSQAPATSGGGGSGATIKAITPFQVEFAEGVGTMDIDFPVGSDVNKTYPVIHDRQVKNSIPSPNSNSLKIFAGLKSVKTGALEFNATQADGVGAISGYWIEFDQGVSVQYGVVSINTSSGDVVVPISTIGNASKSFVIDLSTYYSALSRRNYTLGDLTNSSFTVKQVAGAGGSVTVGYCIVEFL